MLLFQYMRAPHFDYSVAPNVITPLSLCISELDSEALHLVKSYVCCFNTTFKIFAFLEASKLNFIKSQPSK